MNNKKRIYFHLGISTFLFLAEAIIIIYLLSIGHQVEQVNDSAKKTSLFAAFTIESNIYMALISLVGIVLSIKTLNAKEYTLPAAYELLYLSGTSSLSIVLLVVATFLAPTKVQNGESYFVMFQKWNFFNHFLNPVLSIVAFDFILNFNKTNFKKLWLTTLPLLTYGVMYVLNVVLGRWPDFYNFTFGGKYQFIPIVFVVIFVLTFAFSSLHRVIHNRNYPIVVPK